MKINQFSDVILDESDILSGLYSGKITSLKDVNVEDQPIIDIFNKSISLNADHMHKLQLYVEGDDSIEFFDEANQVEWFIPENYNDFNIVDWLYSQCSTEEEKTRVDTELTLFIQQGMYKVLICLKYLVDYMRENDIVWGVGRGSSVASYCLYLIGIHKVDSIKYQLDIKEFLKGE